MRSMWILISVLVALALGQEGPVVDTHYGKVKGTMGESREGKMFYQFKGIPYAKAPERFQAPEIPKHWDETKDATQYGNKCPQYDMLSKSFVGDEDCLNLNVYSPKLPKEGEHTILLPVVVLLHPGKYSKGAGKMLGPKYFMDEEVVVVTINSRLGPFGFLNTGDKYSQGNMGLKDQSMALRWVSLNIEKFGGDKGRVTLMGLGSGGAETLTHLINPLSKGLFHGAVAHSGNPMSPLSIVRNPITQAKRLAEQVGCPHGSGAELVMCLNEMPALDILKKMNQPDVSKHDFNLREVVKFGPSIETILEGQTETDVVLSDLPVKMFRDGKIINKVPLIIGINKYDGLGPISARVINGTENLKKLNDEWETLAPKLFKFDKTAKDPKLLAQKIREFYFQDKEINDETKGTLLNIFTDRFYASLTRFTAKTYTKHAPVYPYYFLHKPENHYLNGIIGKNDMGAGYLDEMQYLFQTPEKLGVPEINKDSKPEELALSKGMVKLWTSFFETGKPTKTWSEGKEWKKLDADKMSFYKIDSETKMVEEPEDKAKKLGFWHDLFFTSKELQKELETPEKESF